MERKHDHDVAAAREIEKDKSNKTIEDLKQRFLEIWDFLYLLSFLLIFIFFSNLSIIAF